MTSSSSRSTCCCCIDLRLGVMIFLGLSMLLSAASVVNYFIQGVAASNSYASIGNIIFAAVTLFFAAKRNVTGYKVCVYIQLILYILLVVLFTFVVLGGSVALSSGAAGSGGSELNGIDIRTYFAVIVGIFAVVLLIGAYFMSVLWRYIRVMEMEVNARKNMGV